ncbi:MAG: hypothetical protein WAM78_01385 [Candidatus Sulfotelmatobacter sp.]
MAVIKVPKPRGVIDPNRPVNALLKAQIEHLHEAERALPLKYRSEIYIRAIQTEGEAAEYIQEITEAIRAAHREAGQKRARGAAKKRGEPVISIAAVADEPAERKAGNRAAAKKPQKKSPNTKKSKN